MVTKKAGCFLIKKETKEIALIYRKKHNDYSFPKGHVEKNESLKENFILNISHDLRSPLSVILGILQCYKNEYNEPKIKEHMDTIKRNCYKRNCRRNKKNSIYNR